MRVETKGASLLANKIRLQTVDFLLQNDPLKASMELSKTFTEGYPIMGRDILAPIALNLTGIGLIIIVAHRYFSESKSWYLNATQGQALLRTAKQTAQPVMETRPVIAAAPAS